MLSQKAKDWVDDYLIPSEEIYYDMAEVVLLDLKDFDSSDGLFAMTPVGQNILENEIEFRKYVKGRVKEALDD
ncbi:hypothetical protein GPK34_00125 [Secundilactobacillus kimchicus]|uniref:hypothetical protein n=1 Tax=Secundilactobacillus kimchicus TaxID=528209 RepID=UPI001C00E3C5|nr:hypothetical protein [Secundilactobacillus kimchicus]MBT9670442.1 hypothetical protein [Secundilactobacillus kimchicus]